MRIFSDAKKKDELMLVFNVGSSSVGGSLFRVDNSGTPKILFYAKEIIPVEETVDVNRLLSLTLKSLDIVTDKIYKAGLGVPSGIFCVLSSPWYVSQTRIINFKKNTPFIFTSQFADSLIQKEVKLFKDEHLLKYSASNIVRTIELKNIKTMLNGYETAQPLNQKATELEMVIFVSIGGEQFLKNVEETVGKHYHVTQIKFMSFALATFTAVRDMYATQDSFLLLDIGGEVTDISMIKKDILRESISFPVGHNSLVRGVASGLGMSLSEADSMLSLFKEGHIEKAMEEKLKIIMDKLRSEWLKNFQESLAGLSNDISIPGLIFVSIHKDLEDFFYQTIKTEQFSQYTLTESKFEIIFLNTKLLHGVVSFEENIVRDPSIIMDSFYINRLQIKT